MIASAPAPTLADHLRAECEEYRALDSLLEQERVALVEVEAERVASITAEKSGLYGRLQLLARRRDACLSVEGIAAAPGAIDKWAERHPEQAAGTLEQWRQLIDLVRKTRRQSMHNGRIANALVQHFRSRLNLLGGSEHEAATIYGRDGSTSSMRFPASIARA